MSGSDEPRFTNAVLTRDERFPLLTPSARRRLDRLEGHAQAPIYNHACGDRIDTGALSRLHVREQEFDDGSALRGWTPSSPPEWLRPAVAHAFASVPYYRALGSAPDDLTTVHPVARDRVLRQPWLFTPDDADLDNLITYNTSGSSGPACDVPAHPEFVASDIPLYLHLLRGRGIAPTIEAGDVGVMTVYAQRTAFVFCSLVTYLDFAGMVKVNLHHSAWRRSGDREAFIHDCNPRIVVGTPLSLAELMTLSPRPSPAAIFSGAMALTSGMRERLEQHFGCPVVDMYGLTELGIVAAADAGGGHRIVPRRVHVEILDPAGRVCAPGERGEIVVSSDENPYLTLLRYRTGDQGSLIWRDGAPILTGLEGRPPVRFRTMDGSWINNVDVSAVLQPLGLAHWTLTQGADGSLTIDCVGDASEAAAATSSLLTLFGPDQVIAATSGRLDLADDAKPYRYVSRLAGSTPMPDG